jgi:hypothetical protein
VAASALGASSAPNDVSACAERDADRRTASTSTLRWATAVFAAPRRRSTAFSSRARTSSFSLTSSHTRPTRCW